MCCASAAALSISLRVVFQRREPALHVRRARAPVVADADPPAGQHRHYFGAQFFAGVLHAAEIPGAVPERGAVQSIGVAGGVSEFVQRGLVVPVRGCELVTFGQRHLVGVHVVKGTVAVHVGDVNPALLDHALGEIMVFDLDFFSRSSARRASVRPSACSTLNTA